MKQYQISYENEDRLFEKFADIRHSCDNMPYRDIIFYLTWTKSAQDEIDTVTKAIEDYFPDSAYYGNEASGNISMGEFSYGINITCYVFEDKNTCTELVWVEQGTSLSTLEDLWQYCRTKKNLRGIELIPAISYLEVLGIDRSVPDIDPGILIFGGASVNYDDAAYGADIIAAGHPMTREGMAVMLYYGTDLHFHSTDILGWKGLGKQMEVTCSTGKVIREIDRVPAYSIYEKYLNLTVEDKDTLVFPLIAEEDGNEFIRTPQIIYPDKSMLMFADIPEGTRVRISYGDKNTILGSLSDKAAEIADYRPEAIKAYSCAARRLFWGDSEVGRETMIIQEIAPVCGFYTGGEILRFGGRLRVLNQTLSLISFREGKGKENVRENIIHENDKSLLSRLTYFAEKIVEEEKEQRLLAESFENAFKSQYQVMYYIDVGKGSTSFLYGDEDAKKFLPIFNADSAEKMFENFHKYYVDAVVVPEDRARVKSFMNAANMYRTLKTNSSMSINYKVRRNLVDPVYTEMRVIKTAETNGNVSAVILAFRLTDEELRTALETKKKLENDARIIGAFSEDFGCVDYIELTDNKFNDECTNVRTSDLLRRLIPEWEKTASFSEKVGMLVSSLVYEEDREDFRAAIKRENILEKLSESDTIYINTRMVIGGEIRYYQVKVSAIRENGHLAGFVAGTRSVDENTRKELETQDMLQNALREAQSASKAKTDFLFNMSHDIRTPMNAILGYTDVALRHVNDTGRVEDSLKKIKSSGNHLLNLINDILEMSRIEAGKLELSENPLDIREVIKGAENMGRALAVPRSIDFEVITGEIENPYVFADELHFNEVLINVISNAMKYSGDGGKVRYTAEQISKADDGKAWYRFEIADNGIGMSEEFLEHIYEDFSREKSSTVSKLEGAGLGLSIVKRIVDLAGGRIDIRSKLGEGTDVRVEFPFRVMDDASIEVFRKNLNIDGDVPEKVRLKGKRVLLVEDNDMNREIAEEILTDAGMNVETAEDGDIAVKKVAEKGTEYYDFILMDIQMPVMNGYDAARAIRAFPKGDIIPIIAVSANAFEEDRQKSLNAGMNAHVAKPVNIRELFDALTKFYEN